MQSVGEARAARRRKQLGEISEVRPHHSPFSFHAVDGANHQHQKTLLKAATAVSPGVELRSHDTYPARGSLLLQRPADIPCAAVHSGAKSVF